MKPLAAIPRHDVRDAGVRLEFEFVPLLARAPEDVQGIHPLHGPLNQFDGDGVGAH